MTHGLEVLLFLAMSFVVVWIGKWAYGIFHPRARIDRELTARDNVAFALALGAYYFGILVIVGGPLSGPSRGGFVHDLLSVGAWGVLAVVLLNVASLATRRVLFGALDLDAEILERGNAAAGLVLAGTYAANALLVLGALSDEGGVVVAAVFWLYAQVLLLAAARVFLRSVRYDPVAEVRRGNRAAALVVAGVLVAMGNVLRLAISGAFEGWARGLVAATSYAVSGLVLLFLVRWLTDWLLLPGVTLHQEVVEQEVPNVGVGYLEALFYVGASLLIGWSL